jgi:hypothetical protein
MRDEVGPRKTAANRLRPASPPGPAHVGQSGTGAGFSRSSSVSLVSCHSTVIQSNHMGDISVTVLFASKCRSISCNRTLRPDTPCDVTPRPHMWAALCHVQCTTVLLPTGVCLHVLLSRAVFCFCARAIVGDYGSVPLENVISHGSLTECLTKQFGELNTNVWEEPFLFFCFLN